MTWLCDSKWSVKFLSPSTFSVDLIHVTLGSHFRINILKLEQNGQHFTDDIIKCTFLNYCNKDIFIQISMNWHTATIDIIYSKFTSRNFFQVQTITEKRNFNYQQSNNHSPNRANTLNPICHIATICYPVSLHVLSRFQASLLYWCKMGWMGYIIWTYLDQICKYAFFICAIRYTEAFLLKNY